MFVLLNFRGLFQSANFFFNIWQLQYGWALGELLVFSQESQRSLAVVVDRTFNLESVDLHASLFSDYRYVILFFAGLILAVGLDHEIILTAKFSWSTVIDW